MNARLEDLKSDARSIAAV